MAKNPKKTKEAEVLDEKAVRELEELKQRLRAETSADMVVLRALMDAERQARGIEQGGVLHRFHITVYLVRSHGHLMVQFTGLLVLTTGWQ